MKKLTALSILAALTLAAPLRADILWGWQIVGNGAGDILSTTEAVGLNDALLSRGPALTQNLILPNAYQSVGWPMGDAPDLSAYLEITLSAASGYEFSITSLDLDHGGGSPAPVNFVLRSSLDGYTSNLSSFTYTNPGNAAASSFSGLTITAQTDVTLRIYGFGSLSALNGNWGLFQTSGEQLVVNGIVTAIPEPATGALAAFGILAALAIHHRRKVIPPR